MEPGNRTRKDQQVNHHLASLEYRLYIILERTFRTEGGHQYDTNPKDPHIFHKTKAYVILNCGFNQNTSLTYWAIRLVLKLTDWIKEHLGSKPYIPLTR